MIIYKFRRRACIVRFGYSAVKVVWLLTKNLYNEAIVAQVDETSINLSLSEYNPRCTLEYMLPTFAGVK